jgi:hypothetical protein
MNLSRVDQIAKAVLYEGYLLYPYRPSALKNQQRFNFGVLYPRAYGEAEGRLEPCSLRTECLVLGGPRSHLEIRLRFLHLQLHSPFHPDEEEWHEAAVREVVLPTLTVDELCGQVVSPTFDFPAQVVADESRGGTGLCRQEAVTGLIEVTAASVRPDVFKIAIRVHNTTPLDSAVSRDQLLMRSLVSTHLILGVEGGQFVSLLDPPAGLEEVAATCQNVGVWPVLVGEPGERDTLLASPIILYDYPQIVPESAGDLFDGTEIDEILSLRIMTLTDDEKREIRQGDDRARQILERTETMPAEQFTKLHGAVRGLRPVKEEA